MIARVSIAIKRRGGRLERVGDHAVLSRSHTQVGMRDDPIRTLELPNG